MTHGLEEKKKLFQSEGYPREPRALGDTVLTETDGTAERGRPPADGVPGAPSNLSHRATEAYRCSPCRVAVRAPRPDEPGPNEICRRCIKHPLHLAVVRVALDWSSKNPAGANVL